MATIKRKMVSKTRDLTEIPISGYNIPLRHREVVRLRELEAEVTKTIMLDEGLTMSSLEIAELTGKEHKHVMRDIRSMRQELGEDESKFGSIYLDAYKREKPCFAMPRR